MTPFIRRSGFVVVLILLFFGAVLTVNSQKKHAYGFFSNALSEAQVLEDVSIEDITYRVAGGAVYKGNEIISGEAALPILQLAYAKTLARRAPLLAIPGTNPDELDRAVDTLIRTRDMLAGIQKNRADASLVRTALYPVAFLRALTDAERARLAFLTSGNLHDEEAYASLQQEVLLAYRSDMRLFKTAFRKAVPRDVSQYASASDIISREGVLHALDVLLRGLNGVHGELTKRKACVAGRTRACVPEDLSLTPLPTPETASTSPSSFARGMSIASLMSDMTDDTATVSRTIIRLANSACTADSSASPLFSFRGGEVLPEHTSYEFPLYLGDIRFVDSTRHTDLPFYAFFATRGITHVYNSPLTYYECFGITQDAEKLLGIRSVIAFAHATPVSAYAQDASAPELKRLEAQLASQNAPVTERDAVAYVNLAQNIAGKTGIPAEIADRITSLTLQIHNQSAGFNNIVADIARIERENVVLVQNGIPVGLDLPYLFYIRSAFPTFFMSHNPSITGVHTPLFERNRIPPQEQPFVYYSALSHDRGSEQATLRDLRFFYWLHVDPTSMPADLPHL